MCVISVIIPVFNVENYLSSCIKSIQNQTIEDIEIILINDGSTDNSGIIADNLASFDARIKVIHKQNGGPSSARNIGIQNSKGSYISFIDSDDWIEPDFLETLYSLALKNNADIVNTGITVEYLKERRVEKLKYSKEMCLTDKSQFGTFFWELHKLKLSNYPVTRLFKKQLITENNFFFNIDVHVGEDLLFNLEAFKCANIICINNLAPYHYMKREIRTLTSGYNPNFLNGSKIQLKAYDNFFKHYSMCEKEHIQFLEIFYIKTYSGYLANLYKRNSIHKYNSRINIIEKDIFNNIKLKQIVKKHAIKDFNYNLFVFLLLNSSPLAMEIIYKSLFFLRYNFEYFYIKYRNLLKT